MITRLPLLLELKTATDVPVSSISILHYTSILNDHDDDLLHAGNFKHDFDDNLLFF